MNMNYTVALVLCAGLLTWSLTAPEPVGSAVFVASFVAYIMGACAANGKWENA